MSLKYIQIISLAAVFGLQFLFEHIFPQKKEVNDWKNERFNISIGVINVLLTLIPAMAMVQWIQFIEDNQLGLLHQLQLPRIIMILLVILLLDIFMYAWHRLNHILPFLWRFHRFHHKDPKMNTTTALRFHTIELLLSYPVKASFILIVGIPYLPFLIYELLFFTSVVIHHSNIYITEEADGIYSTLFASPRMHRIHHSRKWKETNSNFGALLSIWDKLFRTRIKKPDGDVEFGISEIH